MQEEADVIVARWEEPSWGRILTELKGVLASKMSPFQLSVLEVLRNIPAKVDTIFLWVK